MLTKGREPTLKRSLKALNQRGWPRKHTTAKEAKDYRVAK